MIGFRFWLYSKHSIVNTINPNGMAGSDGDNLTLFFPSNHGYSVGDMVLLEGFPNPRYNGYFEIIDVPQPNWITLNVSVLTLLGTSGASVTKLDPVQVNPLDWKKGSIDNDLRKNEVFHQAKYKGKVVFANQPKAGFYDFDYLKNIEEGSERCEPFFMKFELRCSENEEWDEYGLIFKFTLNDGDFDFDRCTFSTTLDAQDVYQCLLENPQEVNILDLETIIETTANAEIELEYTTCAGFNQAGLVSNGLICIQEVFSPYGNPLPITGQAFSGLSDNSCITPGEWQVYQNVFTTVTESPFVVNILTTWVREKIVWPDVGGAASEPPGDGWYVGAATTIGSLDAHIWYRLPYNGAYTTYRWDADCHSGVGDATIETLELPDTIQTYDRNRWFMEAVEYVARKTCNKVRGVKSDFFEYNPPGDAPNYVSGDNYVTGTTNKYDKITISQKSDILNPNSSEPATRGMVQFDDLMEYIKAMFWCWWFIDDDNFLRIEHISYFNRSVGLDLTTFDDGKWIKSLNRYSYKKSEMPKFEKYEWMEAGFEDFLGRDIIYSSACANTKEGENEKIHAVTEISTDLRFVQNNPDLIANDGFVLLANEDDGSGGYQVIAENGELTGQSWNNIPLSWANLHDRFHRHYRIFLNGNMNDSDETFESVQRNKKQVPIGFKPCCPEFFQAEELIVTQIGEGLAEKISWKLKSLDTVINLIFEG